MTDRAGGDGSRRPTKAERKEQARIEREQIQRQMAPASGTGTSASRSIALAVVTVLVVVLRGQAGSDPTSNADGTPAPSSCWPRPPTRRASRLRRGADDRLLRRRERPGEPAITPTRLTSGPRAARSPRCRRSTATRAIRPTPGRTRTSRPVRCPPGSTPARPIWPGAPLARARRGGDLVQPRRATDPGDSCGTSTTGGMAVGQDRVIVAPYDYEGDGGQLPSGVMMPPAAWHRQQNCSQISLPVAFDFTSQYSAPPFERPRVRRRGSRSPAPPSSSRKTTRWPTGRRSGSADRAARRPRAPKTSVEDPC